ncbi:hypothetical protein [Hymenobacter negativus]|uniref:Uncharacterized protein n=1 Tax=Hymenobacter negativus TaxID=2795026 RepID=A0ABS3QN07_9BACT|nr:hypothetical protein [Hymenobacter negativus]MBO2012661.1 hypothetical protein [Hymenobacter negativus]
MRPLFLTLFGCICALVSHAQQPEDHLEPAKGLYTDGFPDYYLKVQEVLYAGQSGRPVFRVVALPSLQLEYAVMAERRAGKCYLTYQLAQHSIWHALQAKTGEKIGVTSQVIEISDEAATALSQLFNAAVAQTHYPKPAMTMQSDGNTYTFITFQNGIGPQAGETWSPLAGTHMGRLVAVAESLRKATSQQQPLPASLLQEVVQLTATFQTK